VAFLATAAHLRPSNKAILARSPGMIAAAVLLIALRSITRSASNVSRSLMWFRSLTLGSALIRN